MHHLSGKWAGENPLKITIQKIKDYATVNPNAPFSNSGTCATVNPDIPLG
jgi:hypothetical protein